MELTKKKERGELSAIRERSTKGGKKDMDPTNASSTQKKGRGRRRIGGKASCHADDLGRSEGWSGFTFFP